MNPSTTNNPCQRCGQDRIVAKTWTEEIEVFGGKSTVKHTQMVCPDPACQAKIEASLAKEEAQRQDRIRVKEEQAQARMNKNGSANSAAAA